MFPSSTRAQSKDLDLVSVVAEAENKSNTRAYHTVSGDTANSPVSIPCVGGVREPGGPLFSG